jgi:hypothetical protein
MGNHTLVPSTWGGVPSPTAISATKPTTRIDGCSRKTQADHERRNPMPDELHKPVLQMKEVNGDGK